MLSLLSAALFLQVQVTIGRDAKGDSTRPRDTRTDARIDSLRARRDSIREARERREPRRIPLTAEHLASAFRSAGARDLLTRARAQRLRHDSTLEGYDAKSYQRISVGFSFRKFGRERLAFRHEDAARIRWQRGSGVRIDVTGSRTVAPIANEMDAEMSGADLYPIPYYPGQEQLWVGSGLAKREVDDRQFVHPLAEGAEAYYTYSLGDSAGLRLPGGTTISLVELRVEARRPQWNVIVGSLWFDRASAQLVRAAYRPAIPLDIVMLAKEENSGDEDDIPRWLRPLRATIKAVTVEYGLHQGDNGGFWWLPRLQYGEGEVEVSAMRLPMRIEQSYQYASVNGSARLPEIPDVAVQDTLLLADTANLSDSLRQEIRERRRAGYDVGEDRLYVRRRYAQSIPVVVSVPKDAKKLERSSDLPESIYTDDESLFSRSDVEELKDALGFGLQAGWDPQPIQVHALWGEGLLRYNRVEGLSAGVSAQQTLGRGYSWRALARLGVADWEPNAELMVQRSDGRRSLGITGYRRLVAANDWGDPLSLGSSISTLLFGEDDGFYYRTTGAELSGELELGTPIMWKVFAERQQNAPKQTDFSVPNLINDVEFRPNIRARRGDIAGAAARARSSHGLDPHGWRLFTDARLEGAVGDFDFARGVGDLTVAHGLGPRLDGALTLGAGTTAGRVPAQRLWYLGGTYTVRGQPASPTAPNAVGNSFWMGRAELGTSFVAARPVIFFDIGWAGDRSLFAHRSVRPISGAGAGASFLDGLVRLDIARGIRPSRGWRADFYLESRF